MKIHAKLQYFNKIIQYARRAYELHKTEISGIVPIVLRDGELHMLEPDILKQTASAGNTTLDKDALAEYFNLKTEELIEYFPFNVFYCWWHSHHTMDAFWSGTDQSTIDEFAKNGPIFALVVNNKKEWECVYSEHVKLAGKERLICQDVDLVLDEMTGVDNAVIDAEIQASLTAGNVGIGTRNFSRPFTPRRDLVSTEQQETMDFNNSFSQYESYPYVQPVPVPTPKWTREDDEIDYGETRNGQHFSSNTTEPKKPKGVKGPRTLKGLHKKEEFEQMNELPFGSPEDIIDSYEGVLTNVIIDYNVGKKPRPEDVVIAEMNEIVDTINHQLESINKPHKYHQLLSMDQINTIDDVIVRTEGEYLNEPDYSKISEHIPTPESLF